ncbi:response regulator [Chitinibacter bivalviorum]|uniref:Virulence sensor protein BvgS n=1 Tax=Chitinibacter bivalviorum TaxID=2739434 RepID=A0A7H9BID1_9NEIS|nr:response regulator [Chitinibacter bivalviorum]QLG88480.1 response regulator [Chitinibacter bivalviorum]
MKLESVLNLTALLDAQTWDVFAEQLVDAVRTSFDAKRVFLILPSEEQTLLVHAQSVIGLRALCFSEPQDPNAFFGMAVEELLWQLREPALSVRPVDFQVQDIWEVEGDDVPELVRWILPLEFHGKLRALLYVELSDVLRLKSYLETASFRVECEALSGMLADRIEALLTGTAVERDEMTRRLQSSLQRAEEYRELLQKLHEVTLRLTQTPDLDTLQRETVRAAITDLGIDRLGLFTVDLEKNLMLGTYGTDNDGNLTDEHWYSCPTPQHQIFQAAAEKPGEVIVKEDAPIYYNKVVVGRGWNSLVGLYADGIHLGWMAADNFLHRRTLMPYQREVMKLFAAIVSQLIRAKMVAQEMHLLNARLSQQTAALAHAKDEAEAASTAKSDFLATISHEIRTPLNGVLGFAQLLADTNLDKEQSEYVGNIRKSGDSLVLLVNDLLDYSKIEAGKFELDADFFNLQEVLEDSCSMLASRAVERRLELVLDIAPIFPVRYYGDGLRLKQVLVNLISNALKFTERGGVYISANIQGAMIEFRIRDTGIGIGKAQQEMLFQRFYQADSSSTRRYGGTGLGLAICKLMLELMHGEIRVDSDLGQGSTFIVRLPIGKDDTIRPRVLPTLAALNGKKVAWLGLSDWTAPWAKRTLSASGVVWLDLNNASLDEADLIIVDEDLRLPTRLSRACPMLVLGWQAPSGHAASASKCYVAKPALSEIGLIRDLKKLFEIQPTPAPARPANLRYQGHVLVAEDNPMNQRVVSAFLRKLGCSVTIAHSGKEAVELTQTGQFDLILMDWQMPEMDGIEATRILRAQQQFENLPIIALTANAFESSEQQCLEAGMDGFLAKPLEFSRLQDTLAYYLAECDDDETCDQGA